MSKPMEKTPITHLLHEIIGTAKPEKIQKGARRFVVTTGIWQQIVAKLGTRIDMMGLWAGNDQIHMALYDRQAGDFAIVSHEISDTSFPGVAASHAPALLAERIINDMFGICSDDLPDRRRWLDHGKWPLSNPLAAKPGAANEPQAYEFHGAQGEGLHQIPVGPVHAGIIEPGHFRFFCAGETVVRLEARLGYTHKGIEKLLEGKTPDEAAPVCARISGDSTVAYSTAFARATESALDMQIPERAHWLRALMGELERLANHFGDIGAICNDAAFALMHAHFGILREDVLRTAKQCFGHRLMMDCVVPGGVACDLDSKGHKILAELISTLSQRMPRLIDLYDNTASLQDRTRNTGFLDPELARKFAAGGYVGRGSGRDFDARRDFSYEPYQALALDVPVRSKGDVDSRIWIRISEVEQSVSLCKQILKLMPDGDTQTAIVQGDGKPTEGFAMVEGFRGDIMVWLRLDENSKISRCHPRDPSQFHWPLLEAVIENNIVADFPLCNKSFNCSYSGSDL